jgi:hypothetical protein
MELDRAWSRRGTRQLFAALGGLAVVLAAPANPVKAASDQWDDAVFCSDWYAAHPNVSLDADKQGRCLIAIASTYLNGEEGSIAPEDILFADDVIRYTIGHPPSANNDSAAEIRAQIPASAAVIDRIVNRQWTVDLSNGEAFVIYDGFLVPPLGDGVHPNFFVAERITVEGGLITEIAIGGVQRP